MIEKRTLTTFQVKDMLVIDGLKKREDKLKDKINEITVDSLPDKELELEKLFSLLCKTEQKVWSLQVEVAFDD